MRLPYTPAEGPDRLPQAMVEAATEHDWAELPEWVKEFIRLGARALTDWEASQATIPGEIIPEQKEVTP